MFRANLFLGTPGNDAYLAKLPPYELNVVRTGFSLQLPSALKITGNYEDARLAREIFSRLYSGMFPPPQNQ